MKHTFTHIHCLLLLLFVIFCLQACVSGDNVDPGGTELSFSTYLAVGDEYTAGYMNGGLYELGQINSFPNLLVKQFNQVGNVSFYQPLFDQNGSGYLAIDSVIAPTCNFLPSSIIFSHHRASQFWQNIVPNREPFRNMGLPKLKVGNLNEESLYLENLFFSRLIQAPDSGTATYLNAIENNPTDFFTLWIGINDVLAYALNGGDNPAYPLTHPDTFRHNFNQMMDRLTKDKPYTIGMIGNVMDISLLPMFTSVSHQYWGKRPCGSFAQTIYIQTKDGVRAAEEDDRILLAADSLLGQQDWGLSRQYAIPGELVLDKEEVEEVQNRIKNYNEVISIAVAKYNEENPTSNFLLLDMWVEFKHLHEDGLIVNGLNLSGEYLSGGFYSLDGLYPTPRGNAFISNLFIERLNTFFGHSIPNIDIAEYKGVEFP